MSTVNSQVLALAARPPVPFGQVYQEHAAFVWRSLRRLGVRPSDLEDVAQDVFVVVHRKLPEFDGRSSVRTWVFGVCLRTAADYRRRAHIRREESMDVVPDSAVPAAQDEAVSRRQARALLDRILDELDEEKRATFVLFELEQWPMAEIAEAMGCPLQTSYARLYAARRDVESSLARLRAQGALP